MKFAARTISVFMLTLIFTATAHAVRLEPYLSYAIGTGEQIVKADAAPGLEITWDAEYGAPLVGLRTGYSLLGLFNLGVDVGYYPAHKIDLKAGIPGAFQVDGADIDNVSYKASRLTAGVTVGFNFGIGAWLSYYPMATMKLTASSSPHAFDSGDTLKGSGFGGGLAFPIFPAVVLTAEYRSYTYEADKQAGEAIGYSYDIDTTEMLLGIAIPFDF